MTPKRTQQEIDLDWQLAQVACVVGLQSLNAGDIEDAVNLAVETGKFIDKLQDEERENAQ